MSTPTPAPWVAHYAPDTGTTIWHDPRAYGDKRRGAVIVCSDIRNQGDVRLIEAAPDMLDLLREAHAALNWQGAEYLAHRIQSVLDRIDHPPLRKEHPPP